MQRSWRHLLSRKTTFRESAVMTPEELRLLLDVHSEGYLRALESMMKEWRTRYDSIEEKCHKMEKAHENEIRELKRSLEYSQKDIDDLKEEI